MSRVALATLGAVPDLTADDRLLVSALHEVGVQAAPAVWDDATVDWTSFDAVIVRSTWDYHLRLPEFLAWLDRLESMRVTLWNPSPLIRWNAHKRYLRDLAADGVPVVPTRWVAQGKAPDLRALLVEEGWAETVAKPAVSATAYRTIRTTANDAPSRQVEFAAATAGCDMLVQPYLPQIEAGELSLMFVEGQYSHAVLKRPAVGDFRVQAQFGGREEPVRPSTATIDGARAALMSIASVPLFARIDGLQIDGVFVLMELELIEPVLFLGSAPDASQRLADAIVRRLARRSQRPRERQRLRPHPPASIGMK